MQDVIYDTGLHLIRLVGAVLISTICCTSMLYRYKRWPTNLNYFLGGYFIDKDVSLINKIVRFALTVALFFFVTLILDLMR